MTQVRSAPAMNARCESAFRGSSGFCASLSSVRRSILSCSYPAPSGNIVRNTLMYGHDPATAVAQPRGEPLVEIPGGGMERAAERLRIGVEAIPEALGHQAADVDDVHPRAGNELEVELYRR